MPLGSHLKNRDNAILLTLLAIGLVLAVVKLGDKSLWLDECFSLWRAPLQSDWWMGRQPVQWKTIFENIAHRDAHPPLYYVLLKLWREIGGLGGDEVWARLLSVFFYLGTVAFSFRLLARYASSHRAAVGGVLAVFSCLLIQFSQEARNYGLSILLGVAATYYFIGILERRRGSAWKYALTVLLGMYAYYYLAFLFVTHAIVIVFRAARERDLRSLLGPWLYGQIAAAALFAPWALWVLPQKFGQVSETKGIATRLLSVGDLWRLVSDLVAGEPDWSFKPVFVAVVCVVVLGYVVVWWRGSSDEGGVVPGVVAASLVGSVVLLAVFPAKAHEFEGKHLAFLLPLLWCGVAAIAPARRWVWALPLLIVAGNLVSLGAYYSQQKQDWDAATGEVYANVTEGDVVLFNPFYLRVPFFHYYTGQGDPAGKRFAPGYTHHVGEQVALSPNMQKNAYLDPEAFRPTRRHDFWIVEVRGSSVARPEPRVHEWCGAFYVQQEQQFFPGLYGDIVLTHYRPR